MPKLATIKEWFDWPARIWAVLTIIFFLLCYLNLVPGYQVRLIKTNTVTPTISLLPGTQLRLGIDNYDQSIKGDIADIKWVLKKGTSRFTFSGLDPTITLPPTETGLYQLDIVVTMLDGSIKYGHASIYVVQDKPAIVTLTQPMKFEITSNGTNPELFKNAQPPQNTIEVYSGNRKWTKAKKVSQDNNTAVFELNTNDVISSFNNQMIIRSEGAKEQLNSYSSIQLPTNSFKSKN